MLLFVRFAVCVFSWAVITVSAFAADRAEVDVETVWRLAVAHSPAIYRARLAGDRLHGEGLSTRTLAEPSLEAKGEWPTGSHSSGTKTEYEVSVAQPLRWGDLSGERALLGGVSRSLGDVETKNETQRVYLEVRELFAEVAALEGLRGGLLKSGARTRRVLERLNSSSALASLQASERALIEAEGQALIAAELALLAEIGDRRGALERLIGAEIPPGNLRQPKLDPLVEPHAFVAAVKGNPEGLSQRLTLQAEQAERRAALNRRERGGEVTPRLVYRRSDDGTDFMGFGFEVPLPVWGASRGERLTDASSREVALAERRFIESPVFDRYLRALATTHAERRQYAELVRGKVIPALERAADAGAKELEVGQISVAQFIALVRDLHERSRDGVDAYLAAIRIGGELQLLGGSLP